jgi:DNA-binding CsgD family transcriptional regulator
VEKVERTCADCGQPSHGTRCRTCHGKVERQRGLDATEKRDREVLAMAEAGVSGRRLATRLGISPAGAGQLLKKAQRREALRQQRG